MKTRIMIFMCLVVLLAVGIFYVTQREQTPTGLATGQQGYETYENVKIEKVKGFEYFMKVKIEGRAEELCLYHRDEKHQNFIPLVLMAFQNQMPINCDFDLIEGEMRLDYIEIYADDTTTNADLMQEIKNVESGINYVKNYLRWIWRYVYYTYRRVR